MSADRKRKRKPRPQRRVITPPSGPVVDDSAASDERLRRASAVATSLGVLVLAGALGLQFFAPATLANLGQGGSLALRIGGVGLVIAGWILGRARRRPS